MSRSPVQGDSYVFSSPAIQSAVQALNPALKSYKMSLDALCADIVAVEKLLDAKMVMIPIWMGTGEWLSTPFSEDHGTYYMLAWEQEPDSNKYRLYYQLMESHPTDPTGEIDKLLESRPLAEAPLRLRVRLFKHIPRFLEVVAREIQQWQVDCAKSMTSVHRPVRKKIEFGASIGTPAIDFSS